MNQATKELIRAIKITNKYELEERFWELKELFNDQIDVQKVVEVFKKEYDTTFKFEGSSNELYRAITKWYSENIG